MIGSWLIVLRRNLIGPWLIILRRRLVGSWLIVLRRRLVVSWLIVLRRRLVRSWLIVLRWRLVGSWLVILRRRLIWLRLINGRRTRHACADLLRGDVVFILQKQVYVDLCDNALNMQQSVYEYGQISGVSLVARAVSLNDSVSQVYRGAALIRHKVDRQLTAVHVVFKSKVEREADAFTAVNCTVFSEFTLCRLNKSVLNRCFRAACLSLLVKLRFKPFRAIVYFVYMIISNIRRYGNKKIKYCPFYLTALNGRRQSGQKNDQST